MSSRLPTWHTYARRVHRIHACVATNRLLTANILKSIAPIRTRKRDFLSTYNYATSTSAVTVLFATASAVAVTALKKNGKHSQWAAYGKSTDWGNNNVLCITVQLHNKRLFRTFAKFKVTLFAILLLDSNRGLRIAYKVNGGSL